MRLWRQAIGTSWCVAFALGCAGASQPGTPTAVTRVVAAPVADHALVRDQAFLKTKSVGAPLPWPVASKSLADESLEELRSWLGRHRRQLSQWPPLFRDLAEAEATVRSWRALRPEVERLGTVEELDLESALVIASFWYFGRNIEEEGAGMGAATIIDKAIVRYPKAALPFALRGFLHLADPAGHDIRDDFARAMTRSPSAELTRLIELALGAKCFSTGNLHRALVHYKSSMRDPQILDMDYAQLIARARQGLEPTLTIPWAARDIYSFKDFGLRSAFFGYSIALPDDWSLDLADPYLPGKPSTVYLDAPADPETGLIHGMMIVSEAEFVSGDMPRKPGACVACLGGQFQPMAPLIDSKDLTNWHSYTSQREVGSQGDLGHGFYVEALIEPRGWSLAEHRKMAEMAGDCLPAAKSLRSDSQSSSRAAPPSRVGGRVRITFTYNASERTLARARDQFIEIMKSVQFDDRTGTAIFPGPDSVPVAP